MLQPEAPAELSIPRKKAKSGHHSSRSFITPAFHRADRGPFELVHRDPRVLGPEDHQGGKGTVARSIGRCLGFFFTISFTKRRRSGGYDNEEMFANVVVQNLRFLDTPIVSVQARDLIRRLLVKESGDRMGMETGAGEIKRHPFFQGLNWALIQCRSRRSCRGCTTCLVCR
ncbi:serine/threonine-protein kinase kipk [Phtheirospermum japonicum]|uniref:non-specific serine/threonine protein kinase n=1 Tax=Phtheirospermum japonicum TaxID=374723 RepID=A0A830BI53_9LAMI|nr:serine/threonine-protein kinase kipk [Phtheirospermum japonicum]